MYPEDDYLAAFNAGLEMAAKEAESWAAQCGAGSGSGEGYRNLAEAFRSRQRWPKALSTSNTRER